MDDTQSKKSYERPAVEVLGTVEEITLQNHTGHHFDATFVAGQDTSILTTS